MITQFRSKRKSTGGKYISFRKKTKSSMGREPIMTKLGDKKLKIIRVRGGNSKVKLSSINKVNVLDKDSNKYQVVDIMDVVENTANRNYIKRKILNKGVVVNTQLGKVKITSRPGQTGTLNGILIKEQ
ncbi:MAG: 30S ribosomal protein S8e [Candidatus Nanoarchaeia archaeon]|nr:30S ribosomal protein S8e [Candidatus Nanoarchaeia archaeon]